jgi:zinc protease
MNDPDWMAARLLNDVVFNGHPYAMNSGGTLTSLTKITADDLRKKLREELTKDRLVISAAGDISESELSAALDEIFGALPEKQMVAPVSPASLPSAASITLYPKDIPQTVMQMALPGIDRQDPDYFAAEIMNFILGGAGFGSRLMDTIREQRGLTYGIYSGLSEMDHADTLNISTSTRNETVKDIIDLTHQEMDKLRRNSITDREMRNAKTYLIGSVPLDLTSTDRISAYMLAFQSEGLPRNYLDLREEKLNSVTANDVVRAATRLLDPQKMTIILVGKPEGVSPSRTVTTLPNVK